MNDISLKQTIAEVFTKVNQDNPAQGDWCETGEKVSAWVDASSLAMGIVLERHGAILEDACWLRPINDYQYINLGETSSLLMEYGGNVGD